MNFPSGQGKSRVPSSLSIIIPAFNEEDAIENTLERCLAARDSIIRNTHINTVEIIVVSDGSTDRTAEIASSYESIVVIAYENNQGYGAAIKLGFSKASGELVGFMDADGTCDPEYFVELCNVAIDESADMVMGCRMHKESKMPGLRWLGNRMYAALVSYLSGRRIRDTATGMRVLRKDALRKLYPLPTGLHFTPAMTFRAIVAKLTICELSMPYDERTGRSKLKILRDGLRFFMSIIEIALCFCPLKFFGCTSILFFLAALAYSLGPVWNLVVQHISQDNFIYRQIAINTFVLAGLLTLSSPQRKRSPPLYFGAGGSLALFDQEDGGGRDCVCYLGGPLQYRRCHRILDNPADQLPLGGYFCGLAARARGHATRGHWNIRTPDNAYFGKKWQRKRR